MQDRAGLVEPEYELLYYFFSIKQKESISLLA